MGYALTGSRLGLQIFPTGFAGDISNRTGQNKKNSLLHFIEEGVYQTYYEKTTHTCDSIIGHPLSARYLLLRKGRRKVLNATNIFSYVNEIAQKYTKKGKI